MNWIGASFLYEEQKGDFARARAASAAVLEKTPSEEGSPGRAAALLEAAGVAALQGDCVDALASCRDARKCAGSDPVLLYRATALEMWASMLRWNCYPGGAGADALEASQGWDWSAYTGEKDAEAGVLEEKIGDRPERDGALFMYRVLSVLPTVRSQLQSASAEVMAQVFTHAMHPAGWLMQQRSVMERNPRMEASLLLIAADLAYRAADFAKCQRFLSGARMSYERAADLAGAATCRMMAGDYRVASKYSPLTMSMPIVESGLGDSGIRAVDTTHPEWSPELLAVAEREYLAAAVEFEAASAPRGVAAILLRQGFVSFRKGLLAEALEFQTRAQTAFEACGDVLGAHLAVTHRLMAQIAAHPAREDLDAAAAIGVWGKTGSFSYALGLGLLMSRMGWRWQAGLGDAERALACFRTARTLFEHLGASLNVAQSFGDLGAAYASIGDRHAAATALESALSAYTSIDQRRPAAQTPGLIYRVADCAGKMYAAYEHVADADGLRYAVARLKLYRYRHFGPRSSGGPSAAAIQQSPLLSKFPATPASIDAPSLEKLGSEMDESARAVAQWTLDMAVDSGRVTEACYRARRAQRNGDDAARAWWLRRAFRRAETAAPQYQPLLMMTVFAHAGDFAEAAALYERNLKETGADDSTLAGAILKAICSPQARGRERLGNLELQALNYARLRTWHKADEALKALAREFGPEWWRIERHNYAEPLALIAEIREGLGDVSSAFEFAGLAAEAVEHARGKLCRETHQIAFSAQATVYRLNFDLARLAAELSDLPADRLPETVTRQQLLDFSFTCAQLNHGRVLQQLIAAFGGSADERVLNTRLATWRSLTAHFRTHGGSSRELRAASERWRRDDDALHRLEAKAASGLPPDAAPESAMLSDLAATIPSDTLLLQFAFLGERLLVWGVTRDGVVRCQRTAIPEYEIDRLTHRLRSRWIRREDAEQERDALSGLLLEPLADLIGAHRSLIVVPAGATHLLPFHALSFRGAPLGTVRSVSVCPSAAILPSLRERPPQRGTGRPLVVGNPSGMRFRPQVGDYTVKSRPGLQFTAFDEAGSAPDLPGAAAEVEWIGSRLAGASVLTGEQATAKAVRELLPEAPVVHLATHGLLVEAAPQWSCVLLANGDTLDVHTLAELRLKADVVVLSACQTAEGEITGGNEVLGLTRALLTAGVRSAVASLWPTGDISTLLLMTRFYEKWLGGESAVAALSDARQWLADLRPDAAAASLDRVRREVEPRGVRVAALAAERRRLREMDPEQRPYAHPFFWAPFIAVGG